MVKTLAFVEVALGAGALIGASTCVLDDVGVAVDRTSRFVCPDVPDGSSAATAEAIVDRRPVGGAHTAHDTYGNGVKRAIARWVIRSLCEAGRLVPCTCTTEPDMLPRSDTASIHLP